MPRSGRRAAGESQAHEFVERPRRRALHGTAAPGLMNRMGATTSITFARHGVYRFVTHAGEDYTSGIRTIGEDNVLKLTVTVR